MKALKQEQADVQEEQRIEWLESVGGEAAGDDFLDAENGLFSKDNEKPKDSVKQENNKAFCVFLDLSSCYMQNGFERSDGE